MIDARALREADSEGIRLLHFVSVLLLSAGLAQADADLCEGVSDTDDLSPQMPPIEDQGLSPWCATFSTKALLDFNVHANCLKNAGNSCKYDDSSQISPPDLSSMSVANPEESRGKASRFQTAIRRSICWKVFKREGR